MVIVNMSLWGPENCKSPKISPGAHPKTYNHLRPGSNPTSAQCLHAHPILILFDHSDKKKWYWDNTYKYSGYGLFCYFRKIGQLIYVGLYVFNTHFISTMKIQESAAFMVWRRTGATFYAFVTVICERHPIKSPRFKDRHDRT